MDQIIVPEGKNVVYGYGRASTSTQVVTADVQEQKCKQWWMDNCSKLPNHVYGGFFYDAATTAKTAFAQRPLAGRIYLEAKRGDMIIMSMYDRAFRSNRDFHNTFHELMERGIKIYPLDMPGIDPTTAVGEMMLSIMAAIKQLELNHIATRTSEAVQALNDQVRESGYFFERAYFGWKWLGMRPARRLIPDIDDRMITYFILQKRKELEHFPKKRTNTAIWKLLHEEELIDDKLFRSHTNPTTIIDCIQRWLQSHRAKFPIRHRSKHIMPLWFKDYNIEMKMGPVTNNGVSAPWYYYQGQRITGDRWIELAYRHISEYGSQSKYILDNAERQHES